MNDFNKKRDLILQLKKDAMALVDTYPPDPDLLRMKLTWRIFWQTAETLLFLDKEQQYLQQIATLEEEIVEMQKLIDLLVECIDAG